MPHENTPDEHADDEFADLFRKLPDPQARAAPSEAGAQPDSGAGAEERTTAAPGRGPASPAPEPHASHPAEPPLSRRERRELQQRAGGPGAASDERPESITRPPASPTNGPASAAPVAASTGIPTAASGRAGATLDDLFSDETPALPTPTEKRRNRRVGGWIALGVVVVLLGGIAGAGAWVWGSYEDQIRSVMGWEEPADYEPGMAEGEALVTIVEGDTGPTISETLHSAGVTRTSGAFYEHLLELDTVPTFYPGVYRLQEQMTSADALAALEDPENKLENSALIREGLTVEQTLPLVADGVGIPIEDLEAAISDPSDYGVEADSLEGWLFPAMYTFDPEVTAEQVIQRMVDRTIESLEAAGVPAEDRQEILTIASIIQREARFEDDFYRVSRVIQNRLEPDNVETNGLLQMDSTAQYGYGEMHDGTVSSTAEALEDDNPWNTYVHPGLPVGPIANPGDLAIDAAMNPVDGPWLYFVTVNLDTGETVFTETNAEHQRAVEQWQQWCADNPDSGC
ncbi:endolytic transglycosylase MltG [Microbacterium sp. LRZ72]|uniref:endolytic transglycosylase MltG n=1 Tax=Microbacterium sp. LRZ72 TaxID=2942481 RepID=UPI0029BE18A5|nr:endolytic transglycosylase MltG [Microbacterium sp. LRZ72]MDX2375377.1 endolytic transglycosylase MltG [Microbacterium sp. LRZ72]